LQKSFTPVESEKTPSTDEKVFTVVDKKTKNGQSEKFEKQFIRSVKNTKIIVSVNRFGFLTVDDDFESRSSNVKYPKSR
jgi:hypothetical protein